MNVMSLHIEPSSTEPIYRQIAGQISRLIVAGQCLPGTRLPSVRDVAAAHAVNPMTVSKAYALLEAQGLLQRQRGKAMLVAAQTTSTATHSPTARLRVLEPLLEELARQAQQLDLDVDDIVSALRKQMENKS